MRTMTIAAALFAISGCGSGGDSGVAPELANKVISGRLEGVSSNTAAWIWGDGVNKLCQGWSSPGFFYGTESPYSSADVQILIAPDILSLNNAESLQYISSNVRAQPGDTVVFRGRNGYFGAWKIDDITPDGLLQGTWYFRSGGGGDFTADVIDVDTQMLETGANCDNIG